MKKKDIELGVDHVVEVSTGRTDFKRRTLVRVTPRKFDRSVVYADPVAPLTNLVTDSWDEIRSKAAATTTSKYVSTLEQWERDQLFIKQKREEERAQYEREREEFNRSVEEWMSAFDGIMVPAESLSSANFDRPPVDLGAELRADFIDRRLAGRNVGVEAFQAIAERIKGLQGVILAQGGMWAGSEQPVLAPLTATELEAKDNDALYEIVAKIDLYPESTRDEAMKILEARVAKTAANQSWTAETRDDLVES